MSLDSKVTTKKQQLASEDRKTTKEGLSVKEAKERKVERKG